MSRFKRLSSRLLPQSGAVWLLILVFVVVVVRSAWLNDDAYITFRTIENFVAGYGLRWNIAERVQTFTHPLWLFLLAVPYAFTREMYFTSLILSIVVSGLTAAILLRWAAKDLALAVLVLLILIFSKAFVDYSTSGLENPLTHLLLVLFFIGYFRAEKSASGITLFWLSLLAGLGALNRFDTILLFSPALLLLWWRQRSWRATWLVVAGFLPFILWKLFSIYYYGFPFSNTAYAKAFNTGLEASALWQSGWHYLFNSFKWDPLTLTVIGAGTAAALVRRRWQYLVVGLGIVLYLLYIVKIGGDFMSGRFLTAPLIMAVLLLIDLYPETVPKAVLRVGFAAAIVALGLQALYPPILFGGDFGYGSRPEQADWESWHDEDIADERVYYYPYTGLINPNRQMHPWQEQGTAVRAEQEPIALHGNVGFFGYYAGPNVHVLDRNALGDPLLARLPIANPEEWRIGHLKRDIPEGYIETLTSGENQIAVPALAAYYERLSLVIRGGLTDPQRFSQIWWLNSHSEVE